MIRDMQTLLWKPAHNAGDAFSYYTCADQKCMHYFKSITQMTRTSLILNSSYNYMFPLSLISVVLIGILLINSPNNKPSTYTIHYRITT
jgi:hypothetical protein